MNPTRAFASTRKTRKLWNKIDADFVKPSIHLRPAQQPVLKQTTPSGEKENNDEENNAPFQLVSTNSHICPLCDSAMSIMDDGANTCTSPQCGFMSGYEVNMGSEGNTGAGEGGDVNADNTRHGCAINPLLPESSFGAQIICHPNASTEMKFMRRIANWGSAPSHEKMLYHEFDYISTMARNADIPTKIIEHAFIIHKCNSEQQLYRGGNRDGVKAGSIYIACILNDCPRTPFEISEMFHISYKNVMFGCTQAMNMIHRLKSAAYDSDLGIGIDGLDFSKLSNIRASHFVPRYCSKLGISGDLLRVAKFVADLIEEYPVKCNSKPYSMAGGIILYLSNQLNLGITKSDISPLCGVSDVTIANCYSWIQSLQTDFIPAVIVEEYKRPAIVKDRRKRARGNSIVSGE